MSTTMSLANMTSTSAFLYCPPVTQSQYTTIYETILPAACETSEWMATYTVTETCVGPKANYVTPTMPPGFVVTTVSCHACHEPEVVITCPGAHPTGMGMPTVQIAGNGVTATIVATPAPEPAHGGLPGAPPAPTGFVVATCHDGHCSASGSGSVSSSDIESGAGAAGAAGCHDGHCSGSGSAPGSGPGPASGSGSGPASGPASGSGAGMGGGIGCHDGHCSGSGSNGTYEHPPVLTGAAASMKRSLMVGVGLAFLAGPFFAL